MNQDLHNVTRIVGETVKPEYIHSQRIITLIHVVVSTPQPSVGKSWYQFRNNNTMNPLVISNLP